MGWVLVVVLVLPLAAGGFAAVAGSARADLFARLGVAATVVSAAGAVVLLGRVAVSGPVSALWVGGGGHLVVGVAADRLSVVLLLLVCGVSALVQGFALRYLAGDPRAWWFVAGTGLLTSASAGLMTAVTLVGLAACWSVAGAGLLLLLATYPQLPAARVGMRRAAAAFLVGDAALWTVVALATARWGSLDLRGLDVRALPGASSGLIAVLGCLVVLAALTRSAQIPFQGWLPATLAAPTPVSALLHAGVINAGGVLLIRLAPLSGGSRLAMGLAFTAGALTTAYGTALMLTKPDVKGALAHSTMGQMGFMIMTCGLGLYAAAVIHLVTHGLYKAGLFLASGTAVHTHTAMAAAPPPPVPSRATRHAITAVSIVGPGLLLGGIVAVLRPTLGGHAGAGALLVFAWATASAAGLGWLRRRPGPAGLLTALLALSVALSGYVALVDAADRWLAPALRASAAPLPGTAALLLAAAVVLGLLSVVRGGPRTGWQGGLHRRLYVLALTAGHVRDIGTPTPTADRPHEALSAASARAQPAAVGS